MKETVSFAIALKRIKYLEINLSNDAKNRIGDVANRWKDRPHFLTGRINTVKMLILLKCIQCISYQDSNYIFCKTRKNFWNSYGTTDALE